MIAAEDEKFIRARRSATRGSTGLFVFSVTVLLAAWGALFWFLPQYLNPMHVFDGIQDGTLSRDTVNFCAGVTVILFHVIWVLLLTIVFCSARGLRREERLLRIIESLEHAKVSATGQSGSWKLE